MTSEPERDGDWKRVRGLAVYRRRRIEGHRDGSRSRIVLVHGSMDRGASFIKAARRLPDRDITWYDRRGYGRSGSVKPALDLDDQVDDLSAIIAHEPATVIGHSLGGLIALTLAARHPDQVLAVGAFEAPMPWALWWPQSSAGGDAIARAAIDGPEAVAEGFMRHIIGDALWERLPAKTRAARRDEGEALLADLRSVRKGGDPYRGRDLKLPVKAGRGTESEQHHQSAANALADEVTGAELVVIEGAGHGAHYTHPDAFADFIRRTADGANRTDGADGAGSA